MSLLCNTNKRSTCKCLHRKNFKRTKVPRAKKKLKVFVLTSQNKRCVWAFVTITNIGEQARSTGMGKNVPNRSELEIKAPRFDADVSSSFE